MVWPRGRREVGPSGGRPNTQLPATVPGTAEWQRCGRASLHAVANVRADIPEAVNAVVMEAADYWLSVGLTIEPRHPDAAARLLA